FGRTTLEYMMLARPVVGVDRGGTAELVVDDETGFLVEPDGGAIADALQRYAHDEALARRHGEAGRARARELADRHGNRAVIEHILANASRSGYRLPAFARHWFALPASSYELGRKA